MSEKIQARLREIAKECGGNRALCEKSGVSERTFANWLAGSSEPKIIGISSIAQAAGVTIDWIVTGAKPKERLGCREDVGNDTVNIAWVAEKLLSGHETVMQSLNVKDYFPFSKEFIKERVRHEDFDQLCVIEVSGDSMMPTMDDGDVVMVDCANQNLNDGLYAYAFKGAIHIKRLVNVADGVEVVSDNEQYPTHKIMGENLNDLSIIGRVLWVARSV